MESVGLFQCRWCGGSSQNACSSTAAGRTGCRNCGQSPNTAASQSCSPASCSRHTSPSGWKKPPGSKEKSEGRQSTGTGSLPSSTTGELQLPPYPIVEDRVLGHAVGFTELLHPASIVAVQHLQAEARAVGAGTPGMDVVTRCQLIAKEQLTVWNTS